MNTTEINFYAINYDAVPKTVPSEVIYYTNPNEAIVFGNFTLEECALAQGIPTKTASSTTTATIGTQTTNKSPNYPVPPPLYFRQPVTCSRCGHLSHTVDRCVAKWNINGERIPTTPTKRNQMYPLLPLSPSRNETHYYNTHLVNNVCSEDKIDYNQFVFTTEEVYDWIDEQHELFVPPLPPVAPEPAQIVYVPIVVRNKTRYAPVMIPTTPDQEIDYILRYNYAMTDYMLEREAALAALNSSRLEYISLDWNK